jgi:membrane protein required for colicin V production
MNGLDYVMTAFFAIGAIYGLQRGALRMLTSVVSLIAALYVASQYYSQAGIFAESQLGTRPAVGAVIGFVLVFALIFAAVEIAGSAVIRLLEMAHLGSLDRLAGGLIGSGVAAAIAGLAIIVMATVMPADSPLLRNSRLVPMLIAYNEMLVRFIPGEAKISYERTRDDLMKFWVENAQNAMKGEHGAPNSAASPSPSARSK